MKFNDYELGLIKYAIELFIENIDFSLKLSNDYTYKFIKNDLIELKGKIVNEK